MLYDIPLTDDLTLDKAKQILNNLENQLEYWNNERKIAIEKAEGVTGISYDKEIVSGGKVSDSTYSIDRVIDVIDPKIRILKIRIRNIMTFIEKEMKRINEYEPIESKIILLREERMKWRDIAAIVNYSERQCRRIYDKYKNKCQKVQNVR